MATEYKYLSISVLCIVFSIFVFYAKNSGNICNAQYLDVNVYSVYDNNGNFLFDRDEIEVGDEYISSTLDRYEIYKIDYENSRAYARKCDTITLPDITLSSTPKPMTNNRAIGLYMSHNDESYITGDGTDSVYGAGGIHDVSKSLKSNLERLGINVYLYENLHIPHDTRAYTRSRVTAKNILSDHSVDAIFDIHRDGASRKTYVVDSNGEHCRVRIVVGKSNSNYSKNLDFAKYLTAVANKMYPWLILDIYMGGGHYNQDLTPSSLLFEMGSHMVEKSLVLKTVPALSEVICTTLYGTSIDQDKNLTIGDSGDGSPNVSDSLKSVEEKKFNLEWYNIALLSIVGLGIIMGIYLIYHEMRRKHETIRDVIDVIKPDSSTQDKNMSDNEKITTNSTNLKSKSTKNETNSTKNRSNTTNRKAKSSKSDRTSTKN